MENYKISRRSYLNAKKLNVIIKPSSDKRKKIDVYNKKGHKIASIGSLGYFDYPNYLKINKELAEKKRDLYILRHQKDINNLKGNGYYAFHILWN
jgi:hypothetical protein